MEQQLRIAAHPRGCACAGLGAGGGAVPAPCADPHAAQGGSAGGQGQAGAEVGSRDARQQPLPPPATYSLHFERSLKNGKHLSPNRASSQGHIIQDRFLQKT